MGLAAAKGWQRDPEEVENLPVAVSECLWGSVKPFSFLLTVSAPTDHGVPQTGGRIAQTYSLSPVCVFLSGFGGPPPQHFPTLQIVTRQWDCKR